MKRLLPLLLLTLLVVGLAWWSMGSGPDGGKTPVAPTPDDSPELLEAPVEPSEDTPATPEMETPPPPSEQTNPWVPDPNGLPIAGRVVDQQGDPIEGAAIQVWRRTGEGLIQTPVFKTPEDGAFRIDGLPEGRYLLWAEAAMFQNVSLRDLLAGRTDLHITMKPAGRLIVRLQARAGADLPAEPRVQFDVSIWRERDGRYRRMTEGCARTAEFVVDGLPAGRYRIGARAIGVGLGSRDDIVVELGQTTEVDLPLVVGALIQGRVLSAATGKPIAGTLVVAGRAGRGLTPLYLMDEDLAFWNEAISARTDDDGNFRIPGLAAGKYDLAARAAGHQPVLERDVSAPTGETPLVLRLAPGGSLEVRVLDRAGKPVADASVDANIDGGSLDGETDAEGRCVIDGLPPGVVIVGAYTNFWSRSVSVKIAAGKTVKARIQAPRGEASLSGMLTTGGVPLADRQISTEFEDGGAVFLSTRSGPDGKYRLEGLPVGTVELVLWSPERQLRDLGERELRPGENTFDFDLPAASILLRVVDERSKEPVPNPLVFAGREYLGMGDRDGVVRIAELDEAPLEILVTSSRHAPRVVEVRPAQKPTEVLVALRSPVTFTVKVVDTDGQPILRAQIGILDDGGREYSAAALRWDDALVANGETRFALAPGAYRLTVGREGYRETEKDVELSDRGAEVRVVLDME